MLGFLFLGYKDMDDIRHFISTYDWSKDALQAIIDGAVKLKASPFQQSLKDKSVAMLFFNPSLRTKTSFEIGISELSKKLHKFFLNTVIVLPSGLFQSL